MTLQEKLNLILDKVSLSEDVKLLWQGVFKYLKTKEILLFIGILEKSSVEEIQKISDNLKRKVEALKNNDLKAWQKIIEEEKKNCFN